MLQNLIKESKEVSRIYETNNYDYFKIKKGNREINQRHISRLIGKISSDGLRVPIQVSPNGEILDGQHRFFACKTLNIPFKFYIEQDKTEIEDIQEMNGINRSWTTDEVLKSKIITGNPHYITFADLYKRSDLKYSTLMHICGITPSYFKMGKLKIDDVRRIETVMAKINQVKLNWKDKISDRFEIAVFNFFKTYPNATVGDLVGKMIKYPSKTYNCSKISEYVDCLFNLYNFNNKKPLIRAHKTL